MVSHPMDFSDDGALDALRSDAELAVDKENASQDGGDHNDEAFSAVANATLKAPLKASPAGIPRPVRRAGAANEQPNAEAPSSKWKKPTTPKNPSRMTAHAPARSPLTPRAGAQGPTPGGAVPPRKNAPVPKDYAADIRKMRSAMSQEDVSLGAHVSGQKSSQAGAEDDACKGCVGLHERLRATEARCARQALMIHKMEVDLTNATADIAQFEAEYEKIRTEGADLYKSYEARCKSLRSLVQAQQVAQETIAEKDRSIASLTAECKRHQESAQMWKEKCRTQASDFRGNFASFKTLSDEHGLLKKAHDELREALEKAECQAEEERLSRIALESESADWESERTIFENTIRSLSAELEALRAAAPESTPVISSVPDHAIVEIDESPEEDADEATVPAHSETNYRGVAQSLVQTMILSALARYPPATPTHAETKSRSTPTSPSPSLLRSARSPALTSPRRTAWPHPDHASDADAAADVAMAFSDSPLAVISRGRDAHDAPSAITRTVTFAHSSPSASSPSPAARKVAQLEMELREAEGCYAQAMIGWARAKVEIECLRKRLGNSDNLEDGEDEGSCRNDELAEMESCDASLNLSSISEADEASFEEVHSPASADVLFPDAASHADSHSPSIGNGRVSFGDSGSPFVVEYAHTNDGPLPRPGCADSTSPVSLASTGSRDDGCDTRAQLRAECEALSSELADARIALETARVEGARDIADLEDRLRLCECDCLAKSHEVASLKAMMSAQENEIATHTSDVAVLEEARDSLEKQNDALRDAEAEYVGRISHLKMEWDERGRVVVSLQAECESLAQAIKAGGFRADKLESELMAQAYVRAELEGKVSVLEAELSARTAELERTTGAMESALAAMGDTDAALRAELAVASQALAGAEGRAAGLDEKVTWMRESQSALEETARKLESEKFELESLVGKLQSAESTLIAECTRLSHEADEARRQRDELGDFVEEERQVRAEIEADLERSLADAHAQCDAAAAEKASLAAALAKQADDYAANVDAVRCEMSIKLADAEQKLEDALSKACGADCARNRRQVADAASRIEAAEARVRLVEEGIVRGLRRDLDARDAEVAELRTASASTEASLERALGCLDDLERRYEARERDVVQPMSGELREMRARLRGSEKDRQALADKLDAMIGMTDGARRESYARFVVEKTVLEGEIAELKARLATLLPLEGEVAQMRKYIRDLTERADKKIAILQDNLRKAEDEVESLDTLLDAVRSAFEANRTSIARLPALAAVYVQIGECGGEE